MEKQETGKIKGAIDSANLLAGQGGKTCQCPIGNKESTGRSHSEEAGESGFRGHAPILGDFEASLFYMIPCLKHSNNKVFPKNKVNSITEEWF